MPIVAKSIDEVEFEIIRKKSWRDAVLNTVFFNTAPPPSYRNFVIYLELPVARNFVTAWEKSEKRDILVFRSRALNACSAVSNQFYWSCFIL